MHASRMTIQSAALDGIVMQLEDHRRHQAVPSAHEASIRQELG
jgi:hypothetical protein